jgi:hypothetical protein
MQTPGGSLESKQCEQLAIWGPQEEAFPVRASHSPLTRPTPRPQWLTYILCPCLPLCEVAGALDTGNSILHLFTRPAYSLSSTVPSSAIRDSFWGGGTQGLMPPRLADWEWSLISQPLPTVLLPPKLRLYVHQIFTSNRTQGLGYAR